MNYSTAVFLINPSVRAVSGTYEAGDNAPRTVFKTLDASLAVGDYVIVPTNTRHEMTVVKIVEVDIDLDFDSATQIVWVIGKIDRAEHHKLLAMEAVAIQTIKSADLRKKRADLKAALIVDAEALNALPIATAGGGAPAIEHKQ